jgi:hypothetical protein
MANSLKLKENTDLILAFYFQNDSFNSFLAINGFY